MFAGGRPDGLFPVNCSTLNNATATAELFGAKRGTYTGLATDRRGIFHKASTRQETIFLDEVHQLDEGIRPQLYRALNEGEFHRMGDVDTVFEFQGSVIAAASSSIDDMRDSGQFPQDLYSRLAETDEIRIPSFNERTEGHRERLIDFGAREWAGQSGITIEQPVKDKLLHMAFPGNVRDLKAIIGQRSSYARRDAVGADAPVARQEHLQKILEQGRWRSSNATVLVQPGESSVTVPIDGSMSLDDIQNEVIDATLRECGDNKTETARRLGIDRRTLYRRLGNQGE